MSALTPIVLQHGLAAEELRRRLLAKVVELSARFSNVGFKADWIDESTLRYSASGLSGEVKLMETSVSLSGDASLWLWPLKSRIEAKAADELAALLA